MHAPTRHTLINIYLLLRHFGGLLALGTLWRLNKEGTDRYHRTTLSHLGLFGGQWTSRERYHVDGTPPHVHRGAHHLKAGDHEDPIEMHLRSLCQVVLVMNQDLIRYSFINRSAAPGWSIRGASFILWGSSSLAVKFNEALLVLKVTAGQLIE